ncbi:hypothetical protein [Roseateles asaccharophilus]|uniref:hypothetical protein n=1 Tax=Roseateles asaccharophilus TaxID=582607 RepID=UPI00384EAE02
MTPDFESGCLRARTLFALSMCIGSRSLMLNAFRMTYGLVESNPAGPYPFVDQIPHFDLIAEDARTRAAAMSSAEAEFLQARSDWHKRRAELASSLPTAEELMKRVRAAEEAAKTADKGWFKFGFHGYTLWTSEFEDGAWDVTNPYGIDYCACLATVEDFESFLDCIRRGKEIGPTPPGGDVDDDDLERDWSAGFYPGGRHWSDAFDRYAGIDASQEVTDMVIAAAHGQHFHEEDPASFDEVAAVIYERFGETSLA